MTLKLESWSDFDNSFSSSNANMLTQSEDNEDGNDVTDTPEFMNSPTESSFHFNFLQ